MIAHMHDAFIYLPKPAIDSQFTAFVSYFLVLSEVHHVVGVGLGVVVADEDRRIADIVHRAVIQVQAVPRLAVRHELIVLAATPVSNGNTAQKHPLDIRTVRAGVGGAARVGGVTGEVDTPSIGHGVLAGKGAVESLGLDLGHCIM